MQFDNAVVYTGSTIEGAAQEMVNAGSDEKPDWKPRYTMKQLLDPDFRLPTEQAKEESDFEDFVDFLEGRHISGLKYDEVG